MELPRLVDGYFIEMTREANSVSKREPMAPVPSLVSLLLLICGLLPVLWLICIWLLLLEWIWPWVNHANIPPLSTLVARVCQLVQIRKSLGQTSQRFSKHEYSCFDDKLKYICSYAKKKKMGCVERYWITDSDTIFYFCLIHFDDTYDK